MRKMLILMLGFMGVWAAIDIVGVSLLFKYIANPMWSMVIMIHGTGLFVAAMTFGRKIDHEQHERWKRLHAESRN